MLNHLRTAVHPGSRTPGLDGSSSRAFRLNREASRDLFIESAEMILEWSRDRRLRYNGKFSSSPARVAPGTVKSFKGRTSLRRSAPDLAESWRGLGIGLLIIPQKPWDMVVGGAAGLRTLYRKVNGAERPRRSSAAGPIATRTRSRRRDARKYIGGYWKSVIRHYELVGDHLTKMKGYESYRAMQESQRAGRRRQDDRLLPRPAGLGHAARCVTTRFSSPQAHSVAGLQRRLQLRCDAVRSRRKQPAAVRERSDARVEEGGSGGGLAWPRARRQAVHAEPGRVPSPGLMRRDCKV